MAQWEYQITLHQIPESVCEGGDVVSCDQAGQCFVHDACRGGGLDWLQTLFREKGEGGWELVQSGYHYRELFCIWKKRVEG
jgi:hypothetical protein